LFYVEFRISFIGSHPPDTIDRLVLMIADLLPSMVGDASLIILVVWTKMSGRFPGVGKFPSIKVGL